MRKIYLLFFTLLFLSCSDESSNNTTDNSSIKPSKLNYENLLYEFFYDGDKIDKIRCSYNGQEGSIFFTYTGNLITKIQQTSPNGGLDDYKVMTYNGNNLIEVKKFVYSGGQTSIYTTTFDYLPNGFVECNSVDEVFNNIQRTLKLSPQGDVIEVDGKIVVYHSNYSSSPYKNIIGLDKLYFAFSPFTNNQGELGGSLCDIGPGVNLDDIFLLPKKNILIGRYDSDGFFVPTQQNYTFNQDGFPTSFSYTINNSNYYYTKDYSWIY
jgi:hypothetical protein